MPIRKSLDVLDPLALKTYIDHLLDWGLEHFRKSRRSLPKVDTCLGRQRGRVMLPQGMGVVHAEITFDGDAGQPSFTTIRLGVLCTIRSFLRDFLKDEHPLLTTSLVPLQGDGPIIKAADFGQLIDGHLHKRFRLRIGDEDSQVLIRFF